MLLFASVLIAARASRCIVPPVVKNFTLNAYTGVWYEMGRYQTVGGGVFQIGCHCTSQNVTRGSESNATVAYLCRRFSPTAPATTFSGHLYDPRAPGQWKEKILKETPAVAYNVVHLDEDSSIEYDCGESFGVIENYCIHILSRTPTMKPEKLQQLQAFALGLGLNQHDLKFQITPQQNCW